jgi:PAS domain S-box-containing protein
LCRILGYERSKLLQKTWAEMTHPDDLAADVAQFNRVMAGEIDGYALDKRWIRKDGQVIDTIVAAKCLRRADGSVDYFVGLVQDITERKRAEQALHEARAALAHVTRVMMLGELMASIAHEVNQPLGAIVTNGQACLRLLAREPPDLHKSREVVERMISDGMRASDVITRIRAMVKKHGAEKVLLNVNEIIQEVIALTNTELSKNEIHLQIALADDLPPVLGDRVQLQQVLLNLILNAKEAMSGVGWQPRALCITSFASTSKEIMVAVRDSGTGLDPRDGERIFDTFFTTKAEGLGLGLSISRTIIEAHGGRLWAAPNEDQGATIQFTLPARGGENEERR